MTAVSGRAASWVLRVTFALMCGGLAARWLGDDGAIFKVLYFDLGLAEGLAEAVEDVGFVLLLVAGILTLTPWVRVGLAWIAVWVTTLMVVSTVRDPYWPAMVPLSQAVRWLGPITLLWWIGRTRPPVPRPEATARAEWLLRIAAAATFVGHGLKALDLRGEYLDYLFVAHRRLLGSAMPQATAEQLLTAIGIVDVCVAGLLLTARWKAVAAWMAFWGAVTAAARMVHSGFGNYAETLLRVPNCGVALAVLVAWWSADAEREDEGEGEGVP